MGDDGGNYHYKSNLGLWLHSQRLSKRDQGQNKLFPEHETLLQLLVDQGNT